MTGNGSPSCRAVPLNDPEDRILAQSKPVADFPIRLTFADQLEYLGCKSIRFDALARSPAEHHAAFTCRRNTGASGGVQAAPWRRNTAGVTPSLLLITRVICAWSAKPQTDAIALTAMVPSDSSRLARDMRWSMM
jgi:hypothetical protein